MAMCKCNPSLRTLFCGAPGCTWIEHVNKPITEEKQSEQWIIMMTLGNAVQVFLMENHLRE
jgi:hypothetical protein